MDSTAVPRPPEDDQPVSIFGSRRLSAVLHPASLSFALVGLLITTFAASALYQSEKESLSKQFENNLENVQRILRQRFDGCETLLRAGLARLRSSPSLSREEWRQFVEELGLEENFPGVDGVGIALVVTTAERGTFESSAAEYGHENFRIDSDGEDPFYVPVLHYEPSGGEEARHRPGNNLMAASSRGVALARARDTGHAAVSAAARPDSDSDAGPSFLVCLPYYARGAELTSIAQRRTAIEGFLFCTVETDGFLAGALDRAHREVGIRIFDSIGRSNAQPLFVTPGGNRSPSFHTTTDVHAGGHAWTVEAYSLAGFENWLFRLSTLAIALAGVAITLLGMIILADSRATQERASRAAKRLAESLQQSESEVRQLNAGLEKQVAIRTAHLREANEELRAFSYTVSHDLRSPVRHVEAMAGFLKEEHGQELSEGARDYVERIDQAAERMQRLIEDILALATCSNACLQPRCIDFSGVAAEVAAEVSCQHAGRDVRLHIEPGLEASCDPAVLRATLQNLLENAFKFTANEETAAISVGAADRGEDPIFFVRDNGVGFDMSDAEKVFLPFKRLPGHNAFPGTGVGLATVRKLIRRHSGDIWVEAAEGAGTTFYFTFNHQTTASERDSFVAAAAESTSRPESDRPSAVPAGPVALPS